MSFSGHKTNSAINNALNKNFKTDSKNLIETKLINFLKRGYFFLKEKKLVRFIERAYSFLIKREKVTNRYLNYNIFDRGQDMKSSNKIKNWITLYNYGRENFELLCY